MAATHAPELRASYSREHVADESLMTSNAADASSDGSWCLTSAALGVKEPIDTAGTSAKGRGSADNTRNGSLGEADANPQSATASVQSHNGRQDAGARLAQCPVRGVRVSVGRSNGQAPRTRGIIGRLADAISGKPLRTCLYAIVALCVIPSFHLGYSLGLRLGGRGTADDSIDTVPLVDPMGNVVGGLQVRHRSIADVESGAPESSIASQGAARPVNVVLNIQLSYEDSPAAVKVGMSLLDAPLRLRMWSYMRTYKPQIVHPRRASATQVMTTTYARSAQPMSSQDSFMARSSHIRGVRSNGDADEGVRDRAGISGEGDAGSVRRSPIQRLVAAREVTKRALANGWGKARRIVHDRVGNNESARFGCLKKIRSLPMSVKEELHAYYKAVRWGDDANGTPPEEILDGPWED